MATRDVNNWLKCYYMQDLIGEEFDGAIAAVVPFGIFVALDSVYVEGLVHVSELGEDYFQFDNVRHQMLGERSGKRFRLGDRVRVRVVRADLESGRIDFVLAAQQPVRGESVSKPMHKAVAKQAEKPAPKSSSRAKNEPATRTKPVAAAKKRVVSKKHH